MIKYSTGHTMCFNNVYPKNSKMFCLLSIKNVKSTVTAIAQSMHKYKAMHVDTTYFEMVCVSFAKYLYLVHVCDICG